MNLNDYTKEVHRANLTWWACLDCDESGHIVVTGRVEGNPELQAVIITCPACHGTKKKIRNVGEMLMLQVSELAEALESHRKNLKDSHIPSRTGLEVEMADLVIRAFDFCAGMGLDLEGAYQNKMEYNSKRPDHKIENRLKENGKKY